MAITGSFFLNFFTEEFWIKLELKIEVEENE